MAVRRDSSGRWRYRKVVRLPDGSRVRVSGTPTLNTRLAALDAERAEIEHKLRTFYEPPRKEVPTFEDWFDGRFWNEWVVGSRNKPSERESKRSIYESHLQPAFGKLRLDEIDDAKVAEYRASLVQREGDDKLSDKRINNILAVLSKTLHYACKVRLIPYVPQIGLLKVERPEIVPWGFDEYAAILDAAPAEGPEWYAAVCLAGDAGLRVGEIRALDWERDVDLTAATLTVNMQMRHGEAGTPKGRTRRVVPMTARLRDALRSLEVLRRGYVVRNLDGTPKTDGQTTHTIYRICTGANLPERGWHTLRHGFGTDAARFGVNPWTLMTWMGHKRIDETMLYVNLAHAHKRPVPPEVLTAGQGEADPDVRALLMLGARGKTVAKGKEAVEG